MNERVNWFFCPRGWVDYAVIAATLVFVGFAVASSMPMHDAPVGWAVSTGPSMAPTLSEGPTLLVYVETGSYEPGDIVVFDEHLSGDPTVHRVVDSWGEVVVAQGDANGMPDHPVLHEHVYGEVVFHVDLP